MMKYLLNYWIYGIGAVIAAGLYSMITGNLCWAMLPIALCTFYLVRAADDYLDYDTDRKEKPLTRQQLRSLIIGLAAIFLLLHLVFFRLPGLGSVLLLGYLAWMNRTEALKLLFLPLLSFYYLSIYIGWRDRRTLIAVAVCLVLAAAFHWYKLRRRKDAEDQQENHHQEG